jgi:hypothetical protein
VETNRTGGIKMAFITDILNTIKNARKGKDMRQAIHDGIEQCYKDATGHPESVAETVKKIGEVSANLLKETADRKAEVNTERKRIDNLIKELPTTAGEYQQSKLVSHGYNNTAVKCTTTSGNYTNVPTFTTDQGGPLSSLHTKKSNYQIAVNKSGLYLFELRIHVNSLVANKRVELVPFINNTRNAALASSYNTVGNFTLTTVAALPIWLSANDTVDFRIAPIDAAEVSLQLGDVLVYAIDWEDKFKIPDYTGYAAETKDIRTGADGTVYGTAGEAVRKQIGNLTEELDNKIEHVGRYKEYDIGAPSVGTYWNKSAKKQLESETYQSFNPISLKAGTYHYENMSGSFTFYEDTDGNWIPIGKYTASGNGDVEIPNDTTMYITEMQKSGVFAGAKLSSGDITQKESNWFKNPKYNIDDINNTLESLSDSVNDIKSVDGSAIKEYCIYVSTTGSDTSGDGSEEKPFATIYHANETITDNSYTKRYRIIVLPGTYTDLQDKYTGITPTGKYQGVITKPWVTYESKRGNPKDTIIEWDGSTGLENPTRDDVVEKCAFHIVSLPRTFTAIKGFTIKSKNTRYAMHCESSSRGIQGEWLIENCIFDWGGCPDISDDTGKFPAIGIGMSPCEKGTIKFCKIVTTTVETMLVHDGKNKDGNSAVILGAELNFIKCDLGTGRLQFQSIYPKSGEINAKTNNVCNLISCTQINNLYSYISSLNSDDEMVWRVYGKDCDFASYGNMSDYVYKIGTANNVSN